MIEHGKISPSNLGRKEVFYKNWDLFNEDWFVSPNGHMRATFCGYEISAFQLDDDDWIIHLMNKTWFDANTFIPAYFAACSRAGIRELKILTHY